MPIQLVDLSEHEIRELGKALEVRADELKKLLKKNDEAGVSTRDIEWHLALLTGDDVNEGLAYKVSSQISQLDAVYENERELSLV